MRSCVRADEVSGSETWRARLEKALTSVVICQTGGGAEEVSADPQKRLFSMKKCTQILYKDGAYRARILALPQTHYC